MPISDQDLLTIQGAIALATMRAIAHGNDEAVEIFRGTSQRLDAEIERRISGPLTLAEARDSGGWYRRIGDARWRKEIDGVMYSKGDTPGAREIALAGSELVTIADAAAGDWEVAP